MSPVGMAGLEVARAAWGDQLWGSKRLWLSCSWKQLQLKEGN